MLLEFGGMVRGSRFPYATEEGEKRPRVPSNLENSLVSHIPEDMDIVWGGLRMVEGFKNRPGALLVRNPVSCVLGKIWIVLACLAMCHLCDASERQGFSALAKVMATTT